MTNSYLGGIVKIITLAIKPLKDGLQDEGKFIQLLSELGWDVENFPVSEITDVSNSVTDLLSSFENLPPSPDEEDIAQIVVKIEALFVKITNEAATIASSLNGLGTQASEFINELPSHLTDLLIVRYLSTYQPRIYGILFALGIIKNELVPANLQRPSYVRKHIDYNTISNLVSDPLGTIKSQFNWNNLNFNFSPIASVLLNWLAGLGKPTTLYKIDSPDEYALYSRPFGNSDLISDVLSIDLFTFRILNDYHTVNLKLIPSLGTTINDTGLLLILDLPTGLTLKNQLSDGISLNVNATTGLGDKPAFLIKPSGIQFKYISNSSVTETGFNVELSYIPDVPSVIFGNPMGTNLSLAKLSAVLGAEFASDVEIVGELDLTGLALNIAAGESDNFIKQIFGSTPKVINFPLTIIWSSLHGISFKGSGSFEYSIETHISIGSLDFESVKIALRKSPSQQSSILLDIGCSISGGFGALSFSVDNLGVRGALGLHSGNLGPFDLKIGFKPPTGIGIDIKADTISGGGFLNFNENTSTYTGGLELKFSKVSLKAIGILTTKMPDGSDGYSLLIIISVEDFTPIQLGLGFTLNGVGGLLGLNRTMNTERLRAGIKDKTLDYILFPKDIVKNANAIISNLGQVFPVKKDRFLIGPMFKIGWGSPTLLTIDLGIIIEMPSPVTLAIIGVLKAILPKESNPILKLQVNFVGILDFEKKQLSFDAEIYDSTFLSFGLFGSMALRLYWGDKPNFLLSIGGFNTRYTPPPMNLPAMRRVELVLYHSQDFDIRASAYFAVTSNTVQFGAQVIALGKFGSLEAKGELGFGILIQFSPFHFIADGNVSFELRYKGNGICGVYVTMYIEGPDPWRVQGNGSVEILWFSVDFSFDRTFGNAKVESIAAVEVIPLLVDAIENKDNWQVIGPDKSHQVVAFRDITTSVTSGLVIDPFGALVLSQKLVPLNIKLSKFGTSAIADANYFAITNVYIPGVAPAGNTNLPSAPVLDFFAPESFFYLLDQDKLSRESFEKYTSGVNIGNTNEIRSDYFIRRKIESEEFTIDLRQRKPLGLSSMQLAEYMQHVNSSYVAKAEISSTKVKTPFGGPEKVGVYVPSFAVADRNNLNTVGQLFDSYEEAQSFRESFSGSAVYADYIVVNTFEI